jgi:diaminopimelate decarboxylase
MHAKSISFAGPGKTASDVTAAIISGVTLHIESVSELNLTQSIAKELELTANIAFRINPIFELKSSGMKMSGGSKPFGIDEELLPEILAQFPLPHLNLRGFHIYSGSQNLNSDAIIDAQQQSFALAKKLINSLNSKVKIDYINIGGGLGIPYFKNETTLDIKPICDNLIELSNQYHAQFSEIEIIMELGRYLVAEAGIYVSKVVDKKTSRGTTYLVCDGGLHHHLANSGNFGQVIRKNYPVVIGNKLPMTNSEISKGQTIEEVSIVGPLCTPLDIIADKVKLPIANIGDYIVIFQSGAYGASASPQEFLSQPALSEILL